MNNNEVFYCPGCKSACKEGELTCSVGATFYRQFKEGKAHEAAEADIAGVNRQIGYVKPLSPVDIDRVGFNPFTRFRWNWALVSAGDEAKSNTMTIRAGATGVYFGKDSVFAFIRDSRYTKEFLDSHEMFSLAFLPEKYRESMEFVGKYSGRDMDNKWEKAALTPVYTDGTVYPKEAYQVFICRKMAAIPLTENMFTIPEIMEKWYADGDMHTMYIGEIVKVLG